ncbi:hypothetical protein FACS1894176_08570 [Bacteroidia bacterium]|nr:hypothetical protein FACS1894176_08570 [Bacteroidia bacterium]
MKKQLLILLFSLGFISNAFATAQEPHILIYKGERLALLGNPLFALYGNSKPDFLKKFTFGDTGCWDGYIAYWEIIGQQLYLTNIVSCSFSNVKADLKQAFGDKCINGKVKADWVTQSLLAGKGGIVYYVHTAWESSWKTELEFTLDQGILKKVTIYDNSKAKQPSRMGDMELMQLLYSKINWSVMDALPKSDRQAKVLLRISADRNGIIDSVEVIRRKVPMILEKEAVRAVKALQEWDVYYKRGKYTRVYWTMPVTFSEELRKRYSTRQQSDK